ncbi:hypothetical protein [Streptacidiphilus sp. PAMC 29251]
MATAQISPKAVAGASACQGSVHGSTKADSGRRHPVRTALRGTGVFLDTAWRVVLLGSDGVDDPRR